ncbi:bifunctional 4-hydroxy-2-oxoglutarate aldolase/2-dehydro-3-deoxy-phosphogluconate aldolase [Flammeovirga kamogawensis]|uniref:Bifunctional 4-hydroxy-2-oxoglutarate aldolase/2-dehydro-3-deoxy-phosphogluconate aldolase n=1 Tax=Flammeovirga kamogawensis TaxID=373891 RepID=A0ABX8H1Z9_9BACT|nr:bifunctional 4-hydroxy-2-oxoglutarate aldolase/2-dehydro-3-deoxy-phosphogluconate aldolase [Flammeovirga kamogawensis]MBB6462323.1 2-dehydro-3-deoxyphosphogluconate aldolase/(4S)-4-hydroxy-2-oxoglutarate aldolase [Flammeovirga kamogawensis]QWG09441.1 bifunctional 4-hydroxy-2-oxoglutarate aldolase/2-dehydro-3-deoxy-phosphogluconate aldolase [Flammeovirga kamogawensis]TRX64957.1 bifunctional 4-hydroxy-2-oxoglutarate aldolase/2-dehydro-3-deoxy-phosphogluconate aldolase [Flammeovirga kamogawensis
MKNNSFSWDAFNDAPVVGIMRGVTIETIHRIIPIYIKAGFSTVEITMNTEGATDLITEMRNVYPDINVGAGTVCSLEDLKNAADAGAQFIVTPVINEEIFAPCKALGLPIFPGALTPTEIYKAWTLGAAAVKVFPCSQFGVGYIKDVMAPLNTIKLLPTGGVDKKNIGEFFKVGAVGVGMGGSLFDKALIQPGKELELEAHFAQIKAEIKGIQEPTLI